ncbi:MAG: hypothetical protein NWE80_01460 [Candidatus Bathyarchaeota archaeon]|nr:hypothetical protein [Candidatus Bathyarchaeota archaeon]
MIQWMAVKAFLKKAYLWIKAYWYVPIGAIFVVFVWFFYRQKAEMLIENFMKTVEAHKKEVETIDKARKKEAKKIKKAALDGIEKREQAEKKYNDTKAEIEEDRNSKEEELKAADTEELAEKIKEMIGE